jgi:DNA-binding response OmpR family regulator
METALRNASWERPKPEAPSRDRPTRVLIADDDSDTLLSLGLLLQTERFEVKLVLNGRPVRDVVTYFQPDVVLLDIGMPDRTGYNLAEELHAYYGDKCPVLVALTARASPADKLQSKNSGFDYHITKPYEPAELVDFLCSLKRRT